MSTLTDKHFVTLHVTSIATDHTILIRNCRTFIPVSTDGST
jgi:hypothetical protein